MSNKTISINTSYFNMGGSKTKKNKEKKEKPVIKQLINPNALKNKFLKRIKEHKQRETNSLDDKKNKTIGSEEKELQFSDEFSDSINYLQTLSKQKKVNDEKTNYEKQKQRRKQEIERKTIKNYQPIINPIPTNLTSLTNPTSLLQVNIDLPEELRAQQNNNPIVLNKPVKDTIPYGVLKGGLKPTYRDWTKTQRNNIVSNPNAALTIHGDRTRVDRLNNKKIDRESRLQNLREKLKNKQQEEQMKNQVQEQMKNQVEEQMKNQDQEQMIIPDQEQMIIPNQEQMIIPDQEQIKFNKPMDMNEEIIATKKITKKTIKKKYTLGKSKIKKVVGILVKDRGTRKQIINAQKDLKKKPLNDVKNYLRDHNLIKVGSNAPNDVIRKIYESAMLSGEITNSNSETLLHNLSKEEKQL